MDNIQQELYEWAEELQSFHLPLWEELPDLDLYMDQVLTLIDKYLSPVIAKKNQPVLTAAMVNNYVKKKMIPAPIKKKYNRKHIAFLLAITSLKQVLSINEIHDGILFLGAYSGIRQAYNIFCTQQTEAIRSINQLAKGNFEQPSVQSTISFELLVVNSATRSYATKLLAEKVIELQEKYLDLEKVENND